MTYTRTIGGEQNRRWIDHNPQDEEILRQIKEFLRLGRFAEAQSAIEPLIAQGNAEALYLGSCFSWGDETSDAFDARHIKLLKQSAEQGFPPALYALGFHFEDGELVDVDKPRAAQLFMRAAMAKHAHSQWLYGICLLYGQSGISQNVQAGLQQILESADAGFQGALESLARFYETGEFGFEVNLAKARDLRSRAAQLNVVTY